MNGLCVVWGNDLDEEFAHKEGLASFLKRASEGILLMAGGREFHDLGAYNSLKQINKNN